MQAGYAGVQPQAGKCQTKGLRRYTRHADRYWIYMLIYSPQQNETKADIAVSGSSIRLQAGHFTFLSWQVACLLAWLLACLPAGCLLVCQPAGHPVSPTCPPTAAAWIDRGEKCFKVNRFCGQFCPSSPSNQIKSGTKYPNESSLSVNDESGLNKCGKDNFQQLK